jgi:hypothetical protein
MRPANISTLLAVLLVASGCGTSTPANADGASPLIGAGPVILIDSMTTVDGQTLPCCSADSGGVRTTVTVGTLTFYAFAHYPDSSSLARSSGRRPTREATSWGRLVVTTLQVAGGRVTLARAGCRTPGLGSPRSRRIVYFVDDDRLVVLVVKVGHRRDIQRRQRHPTSGGAPT